MGCGRVDKRAEPLARPPVLDWEPLPPPASKAEMAREEYEFQRRSAWPDPVPREDLEPVGAIPQPEKEFPEPKQPDLAVRGPRPKPDFVPPEAVLDPLVPLPAPRIATPSAPPPPSVAEPMPPRAAVEIPLAPPRGMIRTQACPPPGRDGVVRCPILAGWAVSKISEPDAPERAGSPAAFILLGILLAAGALDILRRLLR